jgi:acetoin utilization deacetylase AcuC-like enzyme
MGFCLINNVAVAAAWALDRVPRVAIVDWDEHHGNGTQDIFYENPQVLYCSVHEGGSYPGTGRLEERGCGDGDGYTINVPLPRGSRGADFATAFSEVFIPALRRFDPLLLLISAGQDILSDDPLGGMCVEPQDVGAMLGLLLGAFRTPVALVLEGGYGPSHADAIRAIFGALQGGECAFVPGEASAETVRVVRDARSVHGL